MTNCIRVQVHASDVAATEFKAKVAPYLVEAPEL